MHQKYTNQCGFICKNMKVIFGLTCQSCLHPQISAHGTTTMSYLKSLKKNDQAPYLIAKAKSNIVGLIELLKKSHKNGIQAFRISDNLAPMVDLDLYDMQKQLGSDLKKAGQTANQLNMYMSFHPAQFFLLTSQNQKVTENSIKMFNCMAKILSLMKLKNRPIIVTHVGAIKCYSSLEEACDTFCTNFNRLSKQAKQYLTVQNDQTSHSIDSCMYIHNKIKIPVIFDHAHYSYKPVKGINQKEALKMAMSTWDNRIPKVHLCSQASGVKIHNHAQYIDVKDYIKLKQDLQQLGVKTVIMMAEVKKKDQAIKKLRQDLSKIS